MVEKLPLTVESMNKMKETEFNQEQAVEFAKKALDEHHVAIVPGTSFGANAQDYVRFSFAASRDNISQALENIKKMLG